MSDRKYEYVSLPLHDDGESGARCHERDASMAAQDVKSVFFLIVFAVVWFLVGLGVGRGEPCGKLTSTATAAPNGLSSAPSLVPEIPVKETVFEFPTKYEDTGIEGDKLWDEMMPIGSGFIRVPNPRQYNLPQSKSIHDDAEASEIYSLSITHQLHCLGVLRDVIRKYEKKDKSRFAGDGHEYHCLDYRDTTLDFAEATIGPDGIEHRYGFNGAKSTHQCRNWDVIKSFAIEHRSGNKTGIL